MFASTVGSPRWYTDICGHIEDGEVWDSLGSHQMILLVSGREEAI